MPHRTFSSFSSTPDTARGTTRSPQLHRFHLETNCVWQSQRARRKNGVHMRLSDVQKVRVCVSDDVKALCHTLYNYPICTSTHCVPPPTVYLHPLCASTNFVLLPTLCIMYIMHHEVTQSAASGVPRAACGMRCAACGEWRAASGVP